MNGKNINFGNKNILKSDFYNKSQKIFNIDDTDVNKISVSKKEQYGKHNLFKYFIGYNDNNVIRPLYLFLAQTTEYINKFDNNKITMSLMVKDMQFFFQKIEKLMKIDFNTKTSYGEDGDKYIKTKIKTYKDSIITNFYNKNGSKKYQKKKYHTNFYQ